MAFEHSGVFSHPPTEGSVCFWTLFPGLAFGSPWAYVQVTLLRRAQRPTKPKLRPLFTYVGATYGAATSGGRRKSGQSLSCRFLLPLYVP